MYFFRGTRPPLAKRLDHLICEVADIDFSYGHLQGLGFPSVWPVGPFWPGRRTAGVAIGGVNLELVEAEAGAPTAAQVRTLVFEPFDLQEAAAKLRERGVEVEVFEKWESNPDLLLLRGFDAEESKSPQFICRNAYPQGDLPFRFFFCEYSPRLRERLGPRAFPGLSPLKGVTLATPDPAADCRRIDELFGLPETGFNVEIALREAPGDSAEVTELRLDRGHVDLGSLAARFRFA